MSFSELVSHDPCTGAEVWRGALNHNSFGIHDNFFDIGGHSLLLIRVQAGLRERLSAATDVMELFEYTSIDALAKHLESRLTPPSGAETAPSSRAAKRQAALLRRKANA